MPRFPNDAHKRRVIKTLQSLGFEIVREGNHVAMRRANSDLITHQAHPGTGGFLGARASSPRRAAPNVCAGKMPALPGGPDPVSPVGPG